MTTSIKDLLSSGLLTPEDVLIWHSRVQGKSHEAVILQNGHIRTPDGKVHKSPTGALKNLNGNKPVDGWMAWRVKQTGIQLSMLRKS